MHSECECVTGSKLGFKAHLRRRLPLPPLAPAALPTAAALGSRLPTTSTILCSPLCRLKCAQQRHETARVKTDRLKLKLRSHSVLRIGSSDRRDLQHLLSTRPPRALPPGDHATSGCALGRPIFLVATPVTKSFAYSAHRFPGPLHTSNQGTVLPPLYRLQQAKFRACRSASATLARDCSQAQSCRRSRTVAFCRGAFRRRRASIAALQPTNLRMASAAVAAPTLDWQHLSQQLGKKATFEAAAKQACRELAARPHDALSSDAQQLLSRCRTLLRSRYSSRPFWDAGRALFAAAQAAAAASGDGALAAQLGSFVAECNAFLGEEAEEGSSTATPPGGAAPSSRDHGSAFLFEGQLSGRDQLPPRPAGLFDLLSGALGQQLAAAAATAAAQQQLQQEGQVSGAGEQQQERQGSAGGMQAQEGSALADQQQGLAAPSPEALEALERELDAIAVAIMEQTGQEAAAQRAAPPASKKVVASLPVEQLTADRLAALGGAGAARCPVCM